MAAFFPGLGIWYYRSRGNSKSIEKENKKNANKLAEPSTTAIIENEKLKEGNNRKDKNSESTAPKSPPETVEEDPYKQAQTYKNKGNKYFKDGKYADAIKCYQQAIDICPKNKVQDVSTFHQNRAAAFEQLVM